MQKFSFRPFIFGFLAGLASGYIVLQTKAKAPVELLDFYKLVGNANFVKAYDLTAEEFKKTINYEQFKELPLINAIKNATRQETLEVKYTNNASIARNMVYGTENNSIVIRSVLIFQGKTWKIYSLALETPKTSLAEVVSLPETSQIQAMTHALIGDLVMAIDKDDFEEFFQTLSQTWKAQTSPLALQTAFSKLRGRVSELAIVNNTQPVITSVPKLDDSSILLIIGHYPAKDTQLRFTLRFIYEHPQWRPLGVWLE